MLLLLAIPQKTLHTSNQMNTLQISTHPNLLHGQQATVVLCNVLCHMHTILSDTLFSEGKESAPRHSLRAILQIEERLLPSFHEIYSLFFDVKHLLSPQWNYIHGRPS